MFCPIKFIDPSAHTNMQCDPQCAWRAAEITNQTQEELEVYYYCGLISNSTRIEIVNLEGPQHLPLNTQMPDNLENFEDNMMTTSLPIEDDINKG